MAKRSRQPQSGKPCWHCGRTDLGTEKAARATVKIPVRDPITNRVIGARVVEVCNPKFAFRPVCKALVTVYGESHGHNCRLCARYVPPGAEDGYSVRRRGGQKPCRKPRTV